MFNNKIRKSLVATALAGTFALSANVLATDLKALHQEGSQIQRAAVQSQEKINNIYDSNGDDYFNSIKIGDRIFTPRDILEKSILARPVYRPTD